MKRTWWQGVNGAAVLACVAAACVSVAAWGADKPPAGKAAPAANGGAAAPANPKPRARRGGQVEVTDAQVVASMEKAIDFLLSAKKGDNWETDQVWPGINKGGVTAIAVYALLHAGDSLQDDPAYHSKLHWRGPDMAPVIAWLTKNKPEATYTAGIEASALDLVPQPKDAKPEEGVRPGLDACKWYILSAMGGDGGYTYIAPATNFDDLWDKYFAEARKGNRSSAAFTAAKKALDADMPEEYRTFDGPRMRMQKKAADLQEEGKATKDRRLQAKIEAELRELDAYLRDAEARGVIKPADLQKQLATARANLDKDLKRNGDPKGMKKNDPSDKSGKKKIPMTKEDLDKEIDNLKGSIATIENHIKTQFVPFGDLSNGQYGTLGAWALADYDPPIELPNHYWEVQDRFWRLMQNPDGGWPYMKTKELKSTPTMTMAGVASLFIAQEFVDTELRLLPKPDKVLDSGLAWISNNYKGSNDLYLLYGVERVGLNSGLKFFGTQDWYKEGAAALIRSQKADGSWSYHDSATVGTSYALLFLARGRNPVVFNKLQYNGPWNARPRDNAYVTRWLSKKRFEKPINWQVVNLEVSPEEWMDAPVLLITGSKDPKFTKADIEKLRTYINAGGMIFSTADGNSSIFTNAMKKYVTEMVNDKYEVRQLPRNHELFSLALGAQLPNPPPLLGMSNGVREIWIHSIRDVGADWQMRRYANKPAFELAAALYLYASGKSSLRSKLQPLMVAATSGTAAHSVSVARVDYSGNSDPEPGAWQRMAKLARAQADTDITLTTVKFADLDAKKYPLATLTGTAKVTFTADEVQALKKYLDAGGLLFIDAAGGSVDFSQSCEELVKQVYPGDALTPMLENHPVFAGTMPDGAKVGEVEFRKYGSLHLGRRISRPEMTEVVKDGRTRVIFSPFDVCSGFLGTNTWGIVGYAPSTAEILGRNILLYSLNPVPTAPAAGKAAAAESK